MSTGTCVVIGGGIVGAGVLLDAVSRGLQGGAHRAGRPGGRHLVALVSSHPRRPALPRGHAPATGPRGAPERSRLLRLAPHLVRLERFLFPVYGWPLVHRAFYGAGLTLYDLLGAARDGGRAHHLGAGAIAELVPSIRREGLRGGITYTDGVEDDARYSLAVARTAIARGATAVTRVRATDLSTGTMASSTASAPRTAERRRARRSAPARCSMPRVSGSVIRRRRWAARP